jgi:hypothetical protein
VHLCFLLLSGQIKFIFAELKNIRKDSNKRMDDQVVPDMTGDRSLYTIKENKVVVTVPDVDDGGRHPPSPVFSDSE